MRGVLGSNSFFQIFLGPEKRPNKTNKTPPRANHSRRVHGWEWPVQRECSERFWWRSCHMCSLRSEQSFCPASPKSRPDWLGHPKEELEDVLWVSWGTWMNLEVGWIWELEDELLGTWMNLRIWDSFFMLNHDSAWTPTYSLPEVAPKSSFYLPGVHLPFCVEGGDRFVGKTLGFRTF